MKTTEVKFNSSIKSKKVSAFVYQLLANQLPADIYFHNFDHTRIMKKEALILAKEEKLSNEQKELLCLATLFQHTGYTQKYKGHLAVSQSIASSFLEKHNYPTEKIQEVNQLIAVMQSEQMPKSLTEKIACDAYYAYWGLKKYRLRSARLRKELTSKLEGYTPSDQAWNERCEKELQEHYYYTQAAIERYGDRQKINLQKTKKRKKELEKIAKKEKYANSLAGNKAAITMFKTSLRNHIDLTAIADQKSNIMLSVSALLLTIGVPLFATHLTAHYLMLIPTTVFTLTCLGTMFFATLSTRPIKMDGKTNLEQLNTGETNLFFFGNFYNIKVNHYRDAMKKVIANASYLDDSMINDLYYLGNSLGAKFNYLRKCYNTFIIGTVIFIITFAICYFAIQ